MNHGMWLDVDSDTCIENLASSCFRLIECCDDYNEFEKSVFETMVE